MFLILIVKRFPHITENLGNAFLLGADFQGFSVNIRALFLSLNN